MRHFYRLLPAVAILTLQAVSPAANAQGRTPGQEATASLGYVGTTGNTESQTFETQVDYTLRSEEWVHAALFEGLYTQQDSVTNGERYYLEGKSDYQIGDVHYAYGKASYTDDRFSGFDYQAAVSGGYGHYFANRDEFLLEAFGGVGYRQNAVSGIGSEGETIITVGENLEWDFTDSTSVTQSISSEIGGDLSVTKFDIALVSTLVGELSTQIGFQARHISDVPPGRENTDTQTSVSLVYEF